MKSWKRGTQRCRYSEATAFIVSLMYLEDYHSCNTYFIFNPRSQFGGFSDEDVRLDRLVEFVLALSGQIQKVLVLAVDLALAGGDGTAVGQVLLRRCQPGFHLLDVSGGNEALAVVDFHLPPILASQSGIILM